MCLSTPSPQQFNLNLAQSTSWCGSHSLEMSLLLQRTWLSGVVVSLSGAETRPSIRAVQRCFVRSNSISEFLYRTHHISKQTRGQCAALRWLAQSRGKHALHRCKTSRSAADLSQGQTWMRRCMSIQTSRCYRMRLTIFQSRTKRYYYYFIYIYMSYI